MHRFYNSNEPTCNFNYFTLNSAANMPLISLKSAIISSQPSWSLQNDSKRQRNRIDFTFQLFSSPQSKSKLPPPSLPAFPPKSSVPVEKTNENRSLVEPTIKTKWGRRQHCFVYAPTNELFWPFTSKSNLFSRWFLNNNSNKNNKKKALITPYNAQLERSQIISLQPNCVRAQKIF